jgi:uncharacterized membrane protein
MAHLYIFIPIILTVYGQLVIKWQVRSAGAFPSNPADKVWFILGLLLNPWVISCFATAFLSALAWMAAMTKFSLSYAYPFMSLSFVFVVGLSSVFFQDSLTIPKTIGITLIVAGLIIGSRG